MPTVPTAPSSVGAQPAPSPVPSPAAQVVTVVTPLRATADGTYQLSLALHPEGLGTVQATVTVAGASLAVHLATDNPEAHQALSATLPQLRDQLAAGGGQVSVSLRQGGDPSPRGWARPDRQRRGGPGTAAAGRVEGGDPPVAAGAAAGTGTARLVDIRL